MRIYAQSVCSCVRGELESPRRTDRKDPLVSERDPAAGVKPPERRKNRPRARSFRFLFGRLSNALSRLAFNAQPRRKANTLIKKKGPIQPRAAPEF